MPIWKRVYRGAGVGVGVIQKSTGNSVKKGIIPDAYYKPSVVTSQLRFLWYEKKKNRDYFCYI